MGGFWKGIDWFGQFLGSSITHISNLLTLPPFRGGVLIPTPARAWQKEIEGTKLKKVTSSLAAEALDRMWSSAGPRPGNAQEMPRCNPQKLGPQSGRGLA
ncbi:hypothetical protein PABG_11741 [Paracoccidioides brasiliensis Pb03]|nr:hypothetical protein PABG_11741 [Paracoccidioides brasiliensis Pb03]